VAVKVLGMKRCVDVFANHDIFQALRNNRKWHGPASAKQDAFRAYGIHNENRQSRVKALVVRLLEARLRQVMCDVKFEDAGRAYML
jgi:hypothetical protein